MTLKRPINKLFLAGFSNPEEHQKFLGKEEGGEAVLHNQEYTRDLKIVKFYYEKRSSRIQSNYYYIKLLFFTFFKKMILKRCSFLVTFAIKI